MSKRNKCEECDGACRGCLTDAAVVLLGFHTLKANRASTKHMRILGDLGCKQTCCVMDLMKSKDELCQESCE